MLGLTAIKLSPLVFSTTLDNLLSPTETASCSCRSLAVVPLSNVISVMKVSKLKSYLSNTSLCTLLSWLMNSTPCFFLLAPLPILTK